MTSPNESLDQQMREALQRQAAHVRTSQQTDRRGWTQRQWVDDAQRLFDDLEGSVMSLVNGHVSAMLDEIRELRRSLDNGRCEVGD